MTGVGGEGRGNNLYAFAFSENAGSKAQVKELILQKLPSDITAVAQTENSAGHCKQVKAIRAFSFRYGNAPAREMSPKLATDRTGFSQKDWFGSIN